jgi:hypothetical protein
VDEVQEDITDGVASTNGESGNPLHPDPQKSTVGSVPDLHSIPHIESPPKILTVNSFTVTSPLESDTCESTSKNPNKDNSLLTGGGGIKNEE